MAKRARKRLVRRRESRRLPMTAEGMREAAAELLGELHAGLVRMGAEIAASSGLWWSPRGLTARIVYHTIGGHTAAFTIRRIQLIGDGEAE